MKSLVKLLVLGLGTVVFSLVAAASPVERPAGKFVWAELLTSGEPATAAEFYTSVFGWRAETVGQSYDARVRFFLHERPIASIRHRQAENPGPMLSRWLPLFAVPDVAAAAASTSALGGKLLTTVSSWPEGGEHALIADSEGAILGLITASPGEAEDFAAEPDEWIWPLLLVRRPDLTTAFYRDLLALTMRHENRTPLFAGDFVLADGPRARAGVMALPRASPGRPSWLALVRVADLEATVARVRQAGGGVIRRPTEDLIGGRVAVVADPSGAVFGLVQLSAAIGPSASARTPVRLVP